MTCNHSAKYNIQEGVTLRNSDIDTLEKVQVDLLCNHLSHASTSRYYHEVFKNISFAPRDITSTSQLKDLPLTDRSQLSRFSQQFITPSANTTDICYTSGTTGSAIYVPYTNNDLERLAYNEAIAFYSAGVRSHDTILLTVTLDRGFIAGLAYYYGATFLNASVIRSGPGQPEQQWKLIEALKPSVLLGVPSFLLALARWGEAHGYSPEKSSIHSIFTI